MAPRKIPLKTLVYASMFGALTAIGAFISVPLYPVPITLQTVFTALSGFLLGGLGGALSQVVYVLLGIIGLPVFSGGKSGLGVLFGPTGGYLIGFIVAAYVMGRIVEAKRNGGVVWLLLSFIVGEIIIYGCGGFQLSRVANMSFAKTLTVGVIPFLLGDTLKCAAAILVTLAMRKQQFRMGKPALND
jgi:biotin transport system substrate-specific component